MTAAVYWWIVGASPVATLWILFIVCFLTYG